MSNRVLYINDGELAQLLRVSPSTITRLVNYPDEGEIIDVNGHKKVRIADIDYTNFGKVRRWSIASFCQVTGEKYEDVLAALGMEAAK